jgi:Uma2 family endonuclease
MPASYARPTMRGVHGEIPAQLLEDRRRLGHDKRDELWDGVLHMSPSPVTAHNRLARDLMRALTPIADRRGLEVLMDPQALFDPDDRGDPNERPEPRIRNWRVPDLTVVHPDHVSARGTEGHAELVIEVLSPHDESREKLPFYALVQCREVWLVTVDRAIEVYVLRDGSYVQHAPDAQGRIAAPSLGLTVATIATAEGPRLRITDGEDTIEV